MTVLAGIVCSILMDAPTFSAGDPSYTLTYILAVMIAAIVLGASLVLSLRPGNGSFKGTKTEETKKTH